MSYELTEHQRRHAGDVDRIKRVMAGRGVSLNFLSAYEAWAAHSEGYAAGWLNLPDSDDELDALVSSALADMGPLAQ